jgi:hypothetical protein
LTPVGECPLLCGVLLVRMSHEQRMSHERAAPYECIASHDSVALRERAEFRQHAESRERAALRGVPRNLWSRFERARLQPSRTSRKIKRL